MKPISYAVLALSTALAACGGGGGGGDSTPDEPTAPPPPSTSDVQGFWQGTTSNSEDLYGVVLYDGTYYVMYAGDSGRFGVIQGSGSVSGSSFSSTNARDFNADTMNVYSATVSASYTPQQSLSGTISYANSAVSFSASYDASYETPASLSAAAGSYTGVATSGAGTQSTWVTLDANGSFWGSVAGCSFLGSMIPHGHVNVFDVTVNFRGGTCYFGTETLRGIGLYDDTTKQFVALAPNATRDDGFMFYGAKP